jgi:aryl-alcohol dehydrogenase-like predicted oxidoreductase
VTELLQELKSAGLVKYIGLGGTTVYEMARVMETGQFDVVLAAFNYSLLWREAEQAIIPVAQKHNIGLICASPLQQGWLVRRWDDEVNNGARWMAPARRRQFKALYAFLDEIKMPIHELGLRFCLSNPAFSTVMTGAATVGQLKMNLDALAKGPLPKDVLKRCDEISQMCYFRPWEEPMSAQFTNPGYAGTGAAR